ncbi:MAG: hypothetical protein VX294_04345 [Candidatus Latescibacterota bacterium]|nr:hypothetical protein [Candidatus Latescibacterota bacterium]
MFRVNVVFVFFLTVVVTRAELVTSRVLRVNDGDAASVIIEVDDPRTMDIGTGVTLLREGPPIVHPISGAVLGVPHEPVGFGDVRMIDKLGATVVLSKIFSKPALGDVAEYEFVMPAPQLAENTSSKSMSNIVDIVHGLEETVKNYAKSQNTVSAYPVFAKEVWDEINSLRSYLVSIDERLVEYEIRQQEDHKRNLQIAVDDLRRESARELILRYDEDTDVKFEVSGNTLHLTVQRDSIIVDEVTTVGPDGLTAGLEGIETEEIESDSTWFSHLLSMLGSTYVLAGIIVVILIVVMILYFIKQNSEGYDEVVGDFNEDYEDLLDDDDYIMAQELESRDK